MSNKKNFAVNADELKKTICEIREEYFGENGFDDGVDYMANETIDAIDNMVHEGKEPKYAIGQRVNFDCGEDEPVEVEIIDIYETLFGFEYDLRETEGDGEYNAVCEDDLYEIVPEPIFKYLDIVKENKSNGVFYIMDYCVDENYYVFEDLGGMSDSMARDFVERNFTKIGEVSEDVIRKLNPNIE